MQINYIVDAVEQLVKKYGTRNPYKLCKKLGIKIKFMDLERKLKGFFFHQSRISTIVVDSNMNEILTRIVLAHELGHAILHKEIAMMHGFQEMELFETTSFTENEANLFAAELLLEDEEVLEILDNYAFFQTARMLYVPATFLDYKFKILCKKGLLNHTMQISDSKFLKDDNCAYDAIEWDI